LSISEKSALKIWKSEIFVTKKLIFRKLWCSVNFLLVTKIFFAPERRLSYSYATASTILTILQNNDPTVAPDSLPGGFLALFANGTYQPAFDITIISSLGKNYQLFAAILKTLRGGMYNCVYATHPNCKECLFVCLFVPSLSSCHEKATVALYFGRIRTGLGVIHFRVFRLLLLTSYHSICCLFNATKQR